MSIKIYCDSGAYLKVFKTYNSVELYGFEYENINRNIKNKGLPGSNLTFDDFKKNDSPAKINNLPFNDFNSSGLFEDIVKIVRKNNIMDARHLDSAYKNGCDIFLTSDCDDIFSKKDLLEPLLSIKIFLMPKQLNELEKFIKQHQ